MQVDTSLCGFGPHVSFIADDRVAGYFGSELWVWPFREGSAKKYFRPPSATKNGIYGVGPTAGNAHRNLFAMVERGCNPKVYVYSMQASPRIVHVIDDTTTLDLAHLTFSRDGSRLYTLSSAAAVDLKAFSMDDGTLIQGCDVHFDSPDWFQDVAVSPQDMNYLMVVNRDDHDVRIVRLEKIFDRYIPRISHNIVPADNTRVVCYTWAPRSALAIVVTEGHLYVAHVDGRILFAATVNPTPFIYFTALYFVMAGSQPSETSTDLRYWQYDDLAALEGKDQEWQPGDEVVDLDDATDSPFRLRKVATIEDGPIVDIAIAPDFVDAICVSDKGAVSRLILPTLDEVQAEMAKREAELHDDIEDVPVEEVGVVEIHRIGWHHRGSVRDVTFVAEGQASVDAAGVLRIWNDNATKMAKFPTPLTCVANCSAASVIVGNECGSVRLVSTTTLQTLCAVRLSESPLLSVQTAKTSSGALVASVLSLDARIYVLTIEENVTKLVVRSVVENVGVLMAQHLTPSGLQVLAVGTYEMSTEDSAETINVLCVVDCSDVTALKIHCAKVESGDNVVLTSVCVTNNKDIVVGDSMGRVTSYAPPKSESIPSAKMLPADLLWSNQLEQVSVVTCVVPHTGGVLCGTADGSVSWWKSMDKKATAHRLFSPCGTGVVALDCRNGMVVGCDAEGVLVFREANVPPSKPPQKFSADGACCIDVEDELEWAVWSPAQDDEGDVVAAEDDAETQEMKQALAVELDAVRKKLRALVDANKHCPQLEVLEPHEFCIDWEVRDRIAKETRERCDALEAQIKKQNVERQLVRDRLVQAFWDPMKKPGTEIFSLSSQLKVSSYPERVRDEDEQMFKRLKQFRDVEMLEAKWRESPECPVPLRGKAPTPQSFVSGDEAYIINWWPQETSVVKKSLYSPFELVTDARRRMQMVFLRELACEIRNQFNERFEKMQVEKKSQMGTIADRVKRIQQIVQELNVDEEVRVPELDDGEIPELALKVKDGEVVAEKWISPEEQASLDEARAAEEERQRQLRENDMGQRAIQQMMGGTLKTKKDLSPLEITLDREEWMNEIEYDDMTDAQKVAYDEFVAKEKALAEEQAKYRTQLEAELKTLKQNILDTVAEFEAKLKTLHHDRYRTDFHFFCQELYSVRLMLALLQNTEDEDRLTRLQQKGKDYARIVTGKTKNYEQFMEELRAKTQAYEDLQRREKECVQGFKSMFANAGLEPDVVQVLNKFFRQKKHTSVSDPQAKKAPTAKNEEQSVTTSPFPPFAQETTKTNEEDALHEIVQAPEGVDEENMSKMWHFRRERLQLEQQCQQMAEVLAEMHTLHDYLKAQTEKSKQDVENNSKELNDHRRLLSEEKYDIEILLQLKQGQVEVPPSAIVTDYSDAIVVSQEVVESRNRRIIELGAEKVGILSNTREFRKKLNLLDWEHQLLNLRTEDLEERTKDVHMLRVTKDLQRLLKGSDENRNKAECDLLERKLEHTAQAAAQKEQLIRKSYMKVQQEIRAKKVENAMLEKRLRELQQNVMQREHMKRLRAPPGGAKAGGIQGERRKVIGGGGKIEENDAEVKQAVASFRDVEQRRRLMDMAKKQTNEINVLRKELDRLRQKTFPSFVHLHEARIVNPDER